MLRVNVAHFLALLVGAAGIVAMIAALSLSVAHLSVSSYNLVLKCEVSVIVGSRISVHQYKMLCAAHPHKIYDTAAYVGNGNWLVVEHHLVLCRNAERERVLLRHILRFVGLLLLVERRQLAHKSFVHIHRRRDEEECEQHERYIGCRRCVKRRHRVFSTFYKHLVIMFYKPN